MNIGDMISKSPFEKKVVDGYERSVLKEPTEDSEAIVKIVSFPGLVVHRQGGGALAKRLLKEEEEANNAQHARVPPDVQRARRMAEGDKLTGDEGFRTRVLCKSVVHLIWGRQRLLTREAGTSHRSSSSARNLRVDRIRDPCSRHPTGSLVVSETMRSARLNQE